MIHSVRFENFRCLREVELTLEPLTVLVGPPASGKTTVLDGLDLQLGCGVADFWQQDASRPSAVEWRYESGQESRVQYPLNEMSSTPMQTHMLQALTLEAAALREDNSTARSTVLNRTGDNLAATFATLQAGPRQKVVQALCRMVPALGDVGIQQVGPRAQRLKFRDGWKTDLWFGPGKVSDTALVMLAYLMLPYQSPPPDILTLDIPERGLPRAMLIELMKLLRGLSTGELGAAPVQVVLATSSPVLMRLVGVQEVRVLSRSPDDGAAQVSTAAADVADWQQRLEMS